MSLLAKYNFTERDAWQLCEDANVMYLAGDTLVEHHFAVDRLIQGLTMLFRKQNGGKRVLPKTAASPVI